MPGRYIFEQNIRHVSDLLELTFDPARARTLRDLLATERRKYEAYLVAQSIGERQVGACA